MNLLTHSCIHSSEVKSMTRKSTLSSIALLSCMLLLIFDTKTALIGAQDGVTLCLQSVIPSLFPFLFLSIAFTDSISSSNITLLHLIREYFGIPQGTESILFASYLGGYPVGAQCVATLYRDNKLSKVTAERTLGFCNNAGPAFLFGMVSSCFAHSFTPWLLWMIHVGGSIFAASFIRSTDTEAGPSVNENIRIKTGEKNYLKSSILSMCSICGWVILFRIVLSFLKKWILWLFPIPIQTLLCGILELTNGCIELSSISDPMLRFLIATILLAFGGFCVAMQTASVTSGLSLKFYFFGKGIQILFSLCCGWFIIYKNFLPFGILLSILLFQKRKKRKNSSNLRPVGV